MKLRLFTLRKHIHSGIVCTKSRDCLLPELERNLASHIAAESVHTLLHPEAHLIGHSIPDLTLAVIELSDVIPVVVDYCIAQRITHIPICRALVDPLCIR